MFSRLFFVVWGHGHFEGGPEKAGVLAKTWDSWLFHSLSRLCGTTSHARKVQAYLKLSVRLEELGGAIFRLSGMQILRGPGMMLAGQKIKLRSLGVKFFLRSW